MSEKSPPPQERKASYRTKTIPGDKHTPYALARKLDARVVLESSSLQKGKARYSLLLIQEAFQIVQQGNKVQKILPPVSGGKIEQTEYKDILRLVEEYANRQKEPKPEYPFPAGGIGFLGYEYAACCDTMRIPARPDPLELPLAAFMFGHVYIVFDHYTDQIHIIAVNYGDESDIDLGKALDNTEARIKDFNFNYMVESSSEYTSRIIADHGESERFKETVATVREEIIKGNLFQGVPSRRLEIATDLPAIEAYRILRSANPSPYQFFIDFGSWQLLGTSPEVHVKVNSGRVTLRPLAGTRPRGGNEAEDLALEQELLNDEKEKAEHLMLIDLGRNDLGRVCVVGTVNVTEQMRIERYSKVMHIVSQVEGELAEGRTPADVIHATFPAGTVSGAPKIQAVETITALEPYPRSFYAGLVGYFEPGGDFDTCITIRSAVKKGDRLFLQAGAGVVYDSIPQKELDETNHKLLAMALAAGVKV